MIRRLFAAPPGACLLLVIMAASTEAPTIQEEPRAAQVRPDLLQILESRGPVQVVIRLTDDGAPPDRRAEEFINALRATGEVPLDLPIRQPVSDLAAVAMPLTDKILEAVLDTGFTTLNQISPDIILQPASISASPTEPLAALSLPEALEQVEAADNHVSGLSGDQWHVVLIDTGVGEDEFGFISGKPIGGSYFTDGHSMFCSNTMIPDTTCRDELPPLEHGLPLSHAGLSHGSQVAGVVCGSNATVRGVAPACKIISIRITDPTHQAYSANLADALQEVFHVWRVGRKIAAVCVGVSSHGVAHGPGIDCAQTSEAAKLVQNAAEKLVKVGIPLVVGAGNDHYGLNGVNPGIAFPGCLEEFLCVGAVKHGALAPTSNRSEDLAVLAPGNRILLMHAGTQYGLGPGTSIAAPYVAGAFALLRQKVGLSVDLDQLVAAITTAGDPIPLWSGGPSINMLSVQDALNAFP